MTAPRAARGAMPFTYFRKMATKHPESLSAQYNYGSVLYNVGQYSEAIERLDGRTLRGMPLVPASLSWSTPRRSGPSPLRATSSNRCRLG